mmetsp:Transcript_102613/g.319788  ORF Transcript_102613/g.319788 Transcript_102613/m.319788 type:complete len:227 (-) Transcript_102613:25-705(-)
MLTDPHMQTQENEQTCRRGRPKLCSAGPLPGWPGIAAQAATAMRTNIGGAAIRTRKRRILEPLSRSICASKPPPGIKGLGRRHDQPRQGKGGSPQRRPSPAVVMATVDPNGVVGASAEHLGSQSLRHVPAKLGDRRGAAGPQPSRLPRIVSGLRRERRDEHLSGSVFGQGAPPFRPRVAGQTRLAKRPGHVHVVVYPLIDSTMYGIGMKKPASGKATTSAEGRAAA